MLNMQSPDDDNVDYCDSRSPIGKIIHHLDAICKKPKLDGELDSALDVFQKSLQEQERFLQNGIVNINFAEAGLFFQSCSVLYGKKLDILWDQVLDLHTRLIQYDCENDRNRGRKIDSGAVSRLEERRNRYKRKKNFRLAIAEEKKRTCLVLDNLDRNHVEPLPFEKNEELSAFWNHMINLGEETSNVPLAEMKQQTKQYRLDNCRIMRSEDFDVIDIEDGEFNTKYSRMPGWHHIQHLIEYNQEGLLPDKDDVIAKLRLAFHERLRFMRDRKIPVKTPLGTYEEEFMLFRKQFLEQESKKWQNMPLNTIADLKKQILYISNENENPVQQIDHSFEEPCEHDVPNMNNLEIRLEKLPFASIASKLRETYGEVPDNCTSLTEEFGDSSASKWGDSLEIRLEKLPAAVVERKMRQDSGFYDGLSDTPSICDPQEISLNYLATHHDIDIGDSDSDANMKRDVNCSKMNATIIEELAPFKCGLSIIIPRSEKVTTNKFLQKRKGSDADNELMMKRRKLSQKQIHKLLSSLIPPVEEKTFEKFFSMNYQPESGEGEVRPVDNDTDYDENYLCSEDNVDVVSQEISTSNNSSVNDSGFLDGSVLSSTMEDEISHLHPRSPNEVNEEIHSQVIDSQTHITNVCENNENEEEYRRIIAALRESRRENGQDNLELERSRIQESYLLQEKEASRMRIEAWRKTITPILMNLKENDFDIHEYGSRVIEGMAVKEKKHFSHIVKGKSSAETVRYFIASLQLANCANIEIHGVRPGELSNDTFQIELLNMERYHENLREYHAPSEQINRERIENMKRGRCLEQSDYDSSPKKIRRVMKQQPSPLAKKYNRPQHILENDCENLPPHSGITLRWAGSSHTPNPQPSTSYADDPCEYAQASLPSTSAGPFTGEHSHLSMLSNTNSNNNISPPISTSLAAPTIIECSESVTSLQSSGMPIQQPQKTVSYFNDKTQNNIVNSVPPRYSGSRRIQSPISIHAAQKSCHNVFSDNSFIQIQLSRLISTREFPEMDLATSSWTPQLSGIRSSTPTRDLIAPQSNNLLHPSDYSSSSDSNHLRGENVFHHPEKKTKFS